MAEISSTDARALFTKMLIDVYQERIRPTAFLRSFFPTVVTAAKTVSLEVERMGEEVSVDVVRGTEGNRNEFTKGMEKIYLPPFFREYFDATHLAVYDRVLGSQGNLQVPLFTELLNTVADRLGLLQDKIERRQEIMCSQVIDTGIVTMKNGDNIDFKRKAASVVAFNTNSNFQNNNNNPFTIMETGCNFIRQYGHSPDALFNVIMGVDAFNAFLLNTKVTDRQNFFNMSLDKILAPARNSFGAAFHGEITLGQYKGYLWTYPQIYDHPDTGAKTYYVDTKKVHILPLAPRFKMVFAQVPKLVDREGTVPPPMAYTIGNFRDERKAVDEFDIQCAPVPIPVAIDQAYTVQVINP